MVDIPSFEHLRSEPIWPRSLVAVTVWLPHAAFALCFSFILALVLGFI